MNFDTFLEKSKKGRVRIQENHTKNVLNKISFILIEEDNSNSDIFTQKIQNNFIIIDKYAIHDSNSVYLVICFDYTIISVKSPEISQISQFFSLNKDLKIYCISDQAKIFIQQLEFTNQNQYHFIFPQDDQIFIEKEITSFFNQVFFYNSYEIPENKNYFKIIFNCISGFLIKQAYINSKIDRKLHWKELFEKNNQENQIKNKNLVKLRLLAFGSFSTVYLNYNINDDRLYVLKMFENSDQGIKLFERESNNYQNINHPFIPKFYGTIDGNCIIIEYINETTLLNYDIKKLSEKEKISIIFNIMSVIEYLHYNSYVYRDLKPNNIIIDENKNAYLIDFDRLIKVDKNSENEKIQYTVNFVSDYFDPEIINGKPPKFKADIYSLNKILFEFFSIEIDEQYLIQDEYIFPEKPNDEIKPLKISKLIDSFYYDYSICKNEIYDHVSFPFWNRISEYKNKLSYWILVSIYNYNLYIFIDKSKNIRYYLKGFDYVISNDDSDFQYVSHDETNAIYNLPSSFDPNDAKVNCYFGYIYYDGKSIKPDINKAIHYFTIAADQNDCRSQYFLGAYYESINIDKAIYYFTLAANQNNIDAQHVLGLIYYWGHHIKPDINKSIHYFTIAADQNDSKSQYFLGKIYIDININKAMHYLTLSANQNNSEAQFCLGVFYFSDKYITRDINKAMHYLTLSANQNNSEAQFYLGVIYFSDKYITQDINKAIHYFTLSANQNNPDAQYFLAFFYYSKQFGKFDINKALHYLTLSANQDNSESQCCLGLIYYKGEYVAQDINKAIHYFTLSANQNNLKAQLNLGFIYYNEYVTRDINKSIYYFTLSANQNSPEAQYNLGVIYYENKYITGNINKSIYYLSLSSNQNNPMAQFMLGKIYFFLNDFEKALKYFILSANQKNVLSQIALATIYLSNQFVKRDIEKAINYYKLAADQNNSTAQHDLGFIYYEGKYVPKDINKAIYYFQLAASQNHVSSQNSLGFIYLYDLKNIKKAIYYFELAASQNDPYAQLNLGNLYYENKYVIRDIKKAIHYLLESATQKNSYAQFLLGKIHYEGKYVQHDHNKGMHFLKMAANQNDIESQALLAQIYFNDESERNYNKSIYYMTIAASDRKFNEYNFLLGFIYHVGYFIKGDIEKSIHFYKEASSFNNQYAKNNLGILYKNGFKDKVQKNYGLAIEYFKEAIRFENDPISRYNLSHLYLFNEPIKNSVDECINIILSSPNDKLNFMIYILTLALIKKVGCDKKRIENEIKKYVKEEWKNIFLYVSNIINELCLFNKNSFEIYYEKFRKIDYLYNVSRKYFVSYNLFDFESRNKTIKEQYNKFVINHAFYEGLEI